MQGTVFSFFNESARKFPDRDFQRVKLQGDEHFTGVSYGQAYQEVLEIGTGMISLLGVKPGDNIALICDHCPEWIKVNLAIQGIGARDVPRDREVPGKTLESIVWDSQARALILEDNETLDRTEKIREKLPSVDKIMVIKPGKNQRAGILYLKDLVAEGRAQLADGSTAFLDAAERVSPDDISTIIYTSGTEGEPKGAMLRHSSFAYLAKHLPPILDLTEKDSVAVFLTPWHVMGRLIQQMVFAVGASMTYSTPRSLMSDLKQE